MMDERKITSKEWQNILMSEIATNRALKLTQEEQDEIFKRYMEQESPKDWNYVFRPMSDKVARDRFIDLFEHLDKVEEL